MKMISFYLLICSTFIAATQQISEKSIEEFRKEADIVIKRLGIDAEKMIDHERFINYMTSLIEQNENSFEKLMTYQTVRDKAYFTAVTITLLLFFSIILSNPSSHPAYTVCVVFLPYVSGLLFSIYRDKIASIFSGISSTEAIMIESCIKGLSVLMALKDINQQELDSSIRGHKGIIEKYLELLSKDTAFS